MKDYQKINYWAAMLNDAMNDKTCSNKSQLNERIMRGDAGHGDPTIPSISEFRKMLDNGIVEFEFTKADGTLRHAVGTTSEHVISTDERRRLDLAYDQNIESYTRQPRVNYTIWFWDLEKNALRCFNTKRFERVIHNQPTDQHITDNIQQVGNIFIHRDVNDDMANVQNTITAARADEITNELTREFADNIENVADIFLGGGLTDIANDFGDIGIIAGPNSQPILRMEIRKHGHDGDQAYQLKINEIRNYIKNKYHINIKRVEIDGLFEF